MSYEPYLQRMDFYKQRRFICEITGHSGLNFFEALRSEVCQITGRWMGYWRRNITDSEVDGGIAGGEQHLPISIEGAYSAPHSFCNNITCGQLRYVRTETP